ncbi:hypothetical protein ACS0Y6_36765, partial [Burkholderia gladioli]|uniref:hypothetical protein n=1 Tax=Burkholderia gladioli TaxID=28095 RepID=UPI003F7AA880
MPAAKLSQALGRDKFIDMMFLSALNGRSRHLSDYRNLRGDLHFSVPRTDNMHWLEVLLYEKSV